MLGAPIAGWALLISGIFAIYLVAGIPSSTPLSAKRSCRWGNPCCKRHAHPHQCKKHPGRLPWVLVFLSQGNLLQACGVAAPCPHAAV